MEIKTEQINPQVKDIIIGVKKLRSIRVYPLSVKDQMSVADIVVKSIAEFFGTGGEEKKSEVQFAAFLSELIQANLLKILEFVIDKEEVGENILSELTNEQMIEIGNVVYDVNFGTLPKKVHNLLEKIKSEFNLRRSSVIPSTDTLSSDLKTSSENHGEKED